VDYGVQRRSTELTVCVRVPRKPTLEFEAASLQPTILGNVDCNARDRFVAGWAWPAACHRDDLADRAVLEDFIVAVWAPGRQPKMTMKSICKYVSSFEVTISSRP
jgi:hypothetical protein